jgi:hypothetical protein
MGEWMYRSTFFFISALIGGGWSASCPRRFTPRGKSPRYTLDRKLGGPQSRSGSCGSRKIFLLSGLELRPFGRPACSQSQSRQRRKLSWSTKRLTAGGLEGAAVGRRRQETYVHHSCVPQFRARIVWRAFFVSR